MAVGNGVELTVAVGNGAVEVSHWKTVTVLGSMLDRTVLSSWLRCHLHLSGSDRGQDSEDGGSVELHVDDLGGLLV